jgi:tetratricopeptide (TPR) repeat protein
MRFQSLLLAVFLLFSSALWADAAREEKLAQFKSLYADYERFYSDNNWHKAAERAYETLKLGKELFNPTGKNVAALQYNYGFALKQARVNRGSDELKVAMDLYERSYGKDSLELLQVAIDYGNSFVNGRDASNTGSLAKAAKQIIKISLTHHAKESAEHARNMVEAGSLYTKAGDSVQARRWLEKGYEILQARLGEQSLYTAYGAFHLGKWAMARKKYEKAVEYFSAALPALSINDSSSDLELVARAQMVHAYEKLGQRELSTEHCLAIATKTPLMSVDKHKPIFRIVPKIPKGLGRRNGYVILHYDVDEMGFVRNISAGQQNAHDRFVKEAIVALKQFRYAPVYRNGEFHPIHGLRQKFTYSVDYW